MIEVKTTLTKAELLTSYASAQKVRKLSPFKRSFVGPRTDGKPATDQNCRCMYLVFAYESNLSTKDWLKQEYMRCKEPAQANGTSMYVIEHVVVLDRGMINPIHARGRFVESQEEQGIFLDFYLHVVNFINRERTKRGPVDWQIYSARTVEGWKEIPVGS